MKRLFFVLVVLFGLGIFEASAQQEVRGIEVKVVEYEGESYNFRDENGEWVKRNVWYGWVLTNRNSITVSIDVELWVEGKEGEFLYATESIVLDSGESYILKATPIRARKYANEYGGVSCVRTVNDVNRWCKIKYRAYKLE